jgi:ATP-binding cassette, subfamily B, bacterial CvaB/MchF/RaxB
LDLHAERIADIALAEPETPIGSGSTASAVLAGHRAHARTIPNAQDEGGPDGARAGYSRNGGPAGFSGGIAGFNGGLTIEARNLGFAYGPEGMVFRGVNLIIHPGETVALVGPSGCGKTTLLKVLLGLLKPTDGQVIVNGRDLRDWDLGQYRSRLGAVMQEDQLFVGTIEDNISFFDADHEPERVRECAKLALIDADIANTPMGYNTIVGSLGMTLSGGQKQRVLLARALYRQPNVLFLDETLDQIDAQQEQSIRTQLIDHVSTTVFVSHRAESVAGVRFIQL